MYQSHWGMRDSPFLPCHDLRHFYQSATHEEGLARLLFLVEQRRRMGLLTGPHGSGKSLLLEVFGAHILRRGGTVAHLSLLGLEGNDFLIQLAVRLGLSFRAHEKTSIVWRGVIERIREYRYEQTDTVILLDDADRANREVLVQVERLVQHDWSPEARLTIVLAGQSERLNQLDDALLDLAELKVDLEPWEPVDTAEFVKTSLAQAGCSWPVFDEPALARLHELARGIPRRIGQLADLALVAGAGQKLNQIDADVIEAVYQELQAGRR